MEEQYDSREDTLNHIARVQELLSICVQHIDLRSSGHDVSKLGPVEKPVFDKYTPRLKSLTYGSDEYKKCLDGLGVALQHHYKKNSHHPEHYEELGIAGMSLLDLIEMLCDWKAAGERHADGSMARSLDINKERFGISEQLQSVLENTAKELGWVDSIQ
jgi:hypothetical protein